VVEDLVYPSERRAILNAIEAWRLSNGWSMAHISHQMGFQKEYYHRMMVEASNRPIKRSTWNRQIFGFLDVLSKAGRITSETQSIISKHLQLEHR